MAMGKRAAARQGSPLPRVSIVARDVNHHEVCRHAFVVDNEPVTESQAFEQRLGLRYVEASWARVCALLGDEIGN